MKHSEPFLIHIWFTSSPHLIHFGSALHEAPTEAQKSDHAHYYGDDHLLGGALAPGQKRGGQQHTGDPFWWENSHFEWGKWWKSIEKPPAIWSYPSSACARWCFLVSVVAISSGFRTEQMELILYVFTMPCGIENWSIYFANSSALGLRLVCLARTYSDERKAERQECRMEKTGMKGKNGKKGKERKGKGREGKGNWLVVCLPFGLFSQKYIGVAIWSSLNWRSLHHNFQRGCSPSTNQWWCLGPREGRWIIPQIRAVWAKALLVDDSFGGY